MQAIQVQEPHHLRVIERPNAEPLAGEVKVRVQYAGICGSDLHIYHGENPFAKYPRVIGHEFAGEIVAVGENVPASRVGEQVAVDPVVACGECYACRVGRRNVCAHLQVFGVHRDGGFAEEVIVPAGNAHVVPAHIPVAHAAMVEPFSIAVNVMGRTGISAEDTVLVYGAGPIGLVCVQVAKLHGATCIVSDLDDARLARAQQSGADHVINSSREDLAAFVHKVTEGFGATLIIDAVGLPQLLEEAIRIAAPTGRIGLLGFSSAPSQLIQQEMTRKELSLYASRLNRGCFPDVIKWLSDGKLKPELLITHEFPLPEVQAAMDLIQTSPSQVCKVLLKV